MEAPDSLVPATPSMAAELARTLRSEHRGEILASRSGLRPGTCVAIALGRSLAAYAGVRAGKTVFMAGTEAPGLLTGVSQAWMLGTPEIDRFPAFTLRCARWGVAEAFRVSGASALEGWCPAWYGTGLRFLERLGFSVRRHGDFMRAELRRERA